MLDIFLINFSYNQQTNRVISTYLYVFTYRKGIKVSRLRNFTNTSMTQIDKYSSS